MRVRTWSVARQLLALQTLLLVMVLVGAGVTFFETTRQHDDAAARSKVLSLAQSVAANPFVVRAVATTNPTTALQPYAERIRSETGVDFVVIMAPDRTRFTHPAASQIGRPFIGNIDPALRGRALTETFTGTLGPSVRSVVPVRAPDGQVTAMVSIGVTTQAIQSELLHQVPLLLAVLAVLLLVALAGALLVSRRLRRQTRGLDSESISRMYSSYQAVLHSVREGLIVVDTQGRVSVANDEARRLLNLPADAVGRPLGELELAESIENVLLAGDDAEDELHVTGDRVVVLNQSPAHWSGRRYGTVATLRDRTEMESLTGELGTTKAFAEALRSQAHEASNRLHTTVVLIETGRIDDAVRYATAELEMSQRLTDRMIETITEPVLVALLLGKIAQANERGVVLTVTSDSMIHEGVLPSSDLVTIVGNLIDNAIDASAEGTHPKNVELTVRADAVDLHIQVEDSGPGMTPDQRERAFTRGWSTKISTTDAGRGLGLALVTQVVRRHGGTVEVERSPHGGARFTVAIHLQEHASSTH